MINIEESRLGEILVNTNGTPMKIIRYRIAGDITVEFQDEYKFKVNTTYSNFKRRCISNPYSRLVYGVYRTITKKEMNVRAK